MFLYELKEERKNYFLKLCYYAISTDGIINDDEIDVMKEYSNELSIEPVLSCPEETVEEVLYKLSESSEKERRIVLAEIVALLKVDKEYNEKEREFSKSVANHLNYNENELEEFEADVDAFLDSFKRLCSLINDGKKEEI